MHEYCRSPIAQGSRLTRGPRRACYPAVWTSQARGRLLEPDDCHRFDYILTMDEENYRRAAGLCNGGAKIRPLLDYAPGPETEVPDPYYAGPEGFQHALGLIEEASEGLLQEIRERHLGG